LFLSDKEQYEVSTDYNMHAGSICKSFIVIFKASLIGNKTYHLQYEIIIRAEHTCKLKLFTLAGWFCKAFVNGADSEGTHS